MAFMNTTHMKMVSASGAMKRRSPWKASLTWPSTNSTTSRRTPGPCPARRRSPCAPRAEPQHEDQAQAQRDEPACRNGTAPDHRRWRCCGSGGARCIRSGRPNRSVQLTKDTYRFKSIGQPRNASRRRKHSDQHWQRRQLEPGQAENKPSNTTTHFNITPARSRPIASPAGWMPPPKAPGPPRRCPRRSHPRRPPPSADAAPTGRKASAVASVTAACRQSRATPAGGLRRRNSARAWTRRAGEIQARKAPPRSRKSITVGASARRPPREIRGSGHRSTRGAADAEAAAGLNL